MKSLEKAWGKEHKDKIMFNRAHSDLPSTPVVNFANFLKNQGFIPEKTRILDIGCGRGRNSIYLAKQGFSVTGIDFVGDVIKNLKTQTCGSKNMKFDIVNVAKKWPYKNSSFNAIIDCNCTICIPNPDRARAVKEAYRVLKPNGYYLFYGIGQKGLIGTLPGPEPNSGISADGKFEKQYTKKELLEAYKDFLPVDLKLLKGKDIIRGKEEKYFMWVGLFGVRP